MKRKIQLSIFISISLMMLLFCTYSCLGAGNIHTAFLSLDQSLQDPWHDEIFENREFTNLVVSVQAEEEALYSEENGIFTANYNLQGRESERPIQVFVYNQEGSPLIAQQAGIRVSGATSRTAIRKSLRIISRKDYDEDYSRFTYDLWENRTTLDGSHQNISEYSSFILHSMRLAGDFTGINNSVGYSLAKKAGFIDAAPTTPAAVYINGVYQGAYFIIPAKDSHALSELYNIPNHDDIEVVSVFEEEKTGYQSEPEVFAEYLEFVNFVQTSDLNDPEVIEELEQQLDVHQCLQYYAVNLLLANGDWLDNNLRVWRCKNNGLPYQDGRWRFFLFDLDWIGSFPDLVNMNFQQATQSNDHYNLLPSLLTNPEYLEMFKEIIAQMEQDAFNTETIEAVFAEEDARMLSEITYDYHSDSFYTFLQYSINSDPPKEDEYLTLDDRLLLIEDCKGHMLKAPDIINECLNIYYP